MFIWKTETIMNEFSNHLPELYEGLLKIEEAIGKDNFDEVLTSVYGQLINVSIDYGIMEKSSNVYLTKGNFDWNDVGSWEAVFQLSEKNDDGNAHIGDVYTENTYGSYVFSPKKFTAIVGLENLIVINTKDALLICNRENAQDVKNVVEYLKLNNREELL
jgi:mannose-1-phosphate guanylyltransferase